MTWTQEQIDEAAKRLFEDVMGGFQWVMQSDECKDIWRKRVLAAQMPIAEVTEEEWEAAKKTIIDQSGGYPKGRENANEIIARRNAPPKPDLRTRIRVALFDCVHNPMDIDTTTDRILAIVKEQQ